MRTVFKDRYDFARTWGFPELSSDFPDVSKTFPDDIFLSSATYTFLVDFLNFYHVAYFK